LLNVKLVVHHVTGRFYKVNKVYIRFQSNTTFMIYNIIKKLLKYHISDTFRPKLVANMIF
jgi:hypothetical protein